MGDKGAPSCQQRSRDWARGLKTLCVRAARRSSSTGTTLDRPTPPTWMGLPLMDWISLPVPLTTPVVKVWSNPKGLPMANTCGREVVDLVILMFFLNISVQL